MVPCFAHRQGAAIHREFATDEIANNQRAAAASRGTCGRCGSRAIYAGLFCAACGKLLADTAPRERVLPEPPAPTPPATVATVAKVRRRKRRRRRPWFRRPLLVAPLALFVIAAVGTGIVVRRAESTIATIRSFSTPAPVVVVMPEEATDGAVSSAGTPVATGDAGTTAAASPVTIDTGPAQAAIQADAESRGEDDPQDQDGLLGGVRSATTNITDMAGGAVAAAGITDAPAAPLNILIMGVDAHPGQPIDIAVRPDALMVLHLDPTAGTCRLLAIPRDTRANLPGYGPTKINHALMVGGIPYQRLVVEELLGIKLDRYALIDFTGYQELVDALGGITITLPAAINVGGYSLAAGTQTLTGAQTLAYARYRDDADGDYGRVLRQQQIIQALVATASRRDVVRDVNELLPALEEHIRTDITSAEFVALAEQYRTSCTEDRLQMDVLQGTRTKLNDSLFQMPLYYNVVSEAEIRQKVAELIQD